MVQSNWASLGGPAATNSDLSVGQNVDGRLEVFLLSDNVLWHIWQISPNGIWSNWESLNKPPHVDALNRLGVEKNADGRLEIFAIGSDEALWHTWQLEPAKGGWYQWFSSGQPAVGNGQDSLAVQKNADGRLEAFTVGTDGAVWHIWQISPNGTWSNWESLNKPPKVETIFDLVAGKNADGRLEVFAIDLDGTLWHSWQLGAGKGWHPWFSSGQPSVGNNVFLSAVSQNVDGRLEVFSIGSDPDRALWHIWQTSPNGTWSNWESLGLPPNTGGVMSSPAVGKNKDGHLEVLVTSTDGALWHIWQVVVGGKWGNWTSLGTPPNITINNYPLAVAKNADGRLEAFVGGSDGILRHTSQVTPGGKWSS